MNNCDMTEEEAKSIEKSYHDLYKVSDEYCENRIKQASIDGYATVAFGLKIRCHKLQQSLLDNKHTPKEAQEEKRTINNAFGQSYGLLILRALNEFCSIVRAYGLQKHILPVNSVHDCLYFLVRNDINTILFLNKYLSKAFMWQEDVAIKHDKVKLGGELALFIPNWSNEISIPNQCDEELLLNLIQDGK